ncbi:hypothetical protein ACJZ2D_004252 [Fusarium nematophilum]
MNVSATETEVYHTPAPQQCQPSSPALLLPALDLTFVEVDFAQPQKARGICCSVKNVWYSKNHWPEDEQCARLFKKAHETQRMLEPELENIWNPVSKWGSFRKKALASTPPYAIELRMAGPRRDAEEQITVQPSVWIRTTDEAIRASTPWKELKCRVEKLGLHSPQYASIYAEGGLRLADDGVAVAKEHLALDKGITFPGGEVLYTHIQAKPPRGSACGLLCLTTLIRDNTILEQNLSRIGGLISYKSSRQGVTSGHVMLQHFLRSGFEDSLSAVPGERPGGDDRAGSPSGSSDAQESDDDLELIENHQSWNGGQHAAQVLGHVDLAGLTQWISVTPSDTINFIAQAQKDPTQSSTWRVHLPRRPIPADFALISGIADWEYDNHYLNPLAQEFQHGVSLGEKKWVSGYRDDISLRAGDVLILVGPESQHTLASLQTSRIPLIIDGATFWTRKLSLKAPLGRGTSGSWVIDKICGALCGSIIAVFDGEPCALMITAQTLLSDISNYSSLAAEQTTPPVVAQSLGQSVQATTASEARDGYTANPQGKFAQSHWENTGTSDDDQAESIDAGSSLCEDTASSTTSIASSIFKYQVIDGRTYQLAYGKYWAPNDETASEALDILHHTSTLVLDGKLYLAPLEKKEIRKVLDIGTGTGIWAIDFSDEFPEAEVIGIDISPIQPTWVPPNVRFEIDDFTLDWTFHDDLADFIHMRFLRGSVSDWHALYKNAFRATKPGGWIETHEDNPVFYSHDGSIKDGSAIARWGKLFQGGSEKLGRCFTPIPHNLQEEGLEAAGFVDIQSRIIQVPVGSWPKEERLKEIGLLAKMSLSVDVQGQIGFMAHLCGWTSEEIAVYCTRFRDELESMTAHAYYDQQIVWGRKPEKGEASL